MDTKEIMVKFVRTHKTKFDLQLQKNRDLVVEVIQKTRQ